ncbi:MAG: hypothetical protein V4573_03545 [Pseudomonadota bacterium]
MGMTACSGPSLEKNSSTTVRLAGDTYIISQLTAGTWTATAAGAPKAINGTPADKLSLLSAIEKASGCKVTDSDYSRQGMQLDAQVDCGSRLKN